MIVLPKEHGAWAMLLVPYVIGAAVAGGLSAPVVAGALGILVLFLSRPPLTLLIKRRIINGAFGEGAGQLALNFILLASTGIVIFIWLMAAENLWALLLFIMIGAILFLVHQLLIFKQRERSTVPELVGIMLLTLTAPLAYYLAAATLAREAWMLWLLCALYFGASVFYVKMKLGVKARHRGKPSESKNLRAARSSIAYLFIMAAAVGVMTLAGLAPGLVPVSYLPMATYLLVNIFRPGLISSLMVEGIMQTVLSLSFGILIIIAYNAS